MDSPTQLGALPGWDGTDSSPVTPRRVRARELTVKLAELADRLVLGELDDAEADDLIRAVDSALATERVASDDPIIGLDRHPWMGLANVNAPPMRLSWDGTTLHGTAWCGSRFEGTVGTLHGGVIAGMFDAMVATRGTLSGAWITAHLEIDYLAPTPVMHNLQMSAAVERIEGRKVFVHATLSADDRLCARATALMLSP